MNCSMKAGLFAFRHVKDDEKFILTIFAGNCPKVRLLSVIMIFSIRFFLFFLQINGLPENRLRERQVKVNQVMSPFVALRYLILS